MVPPVEEPDASEFPHLFGRIKPCLAKATANDGRGKISPDDREAIRQRSGEIGKKLDEVKARQSAPRSGSLAGAGKAAEGAFGQAFRYAAELVVGVVVGVLIGGFLDRQFGTGPWLLVLFLILGFAAGMLNLVRSARKAQAENEKLQNGRPIGGR